MKMGFKEEILEKVKDKNFLLAKEASATQSAAVFEKNLKKQEITLSSVDVGDKSKLLEKLIFNGSFGALMYLMLFVFCVLARIGCLG